MKIIDFESVRNAAKTMNPAVWYDWVEDALVHKDEFACPPKSRISQDNGDYFNIMPAMYETKNVAMVKMIGRHGNNVEGVQRSVMMGDMLIYESESGILKAVMDAEYITTLRTGAVAAHSALLFGKKGFNTIGLIGLGNIMTACFETLLAKMKVDGQERNLTVKLYKHHGQEKRFTERFKDARSVHFIFCNSYEEVFNDSDVIISAVTKTTQDFTVDEYFKKGVTVIPICTMGFQNCDLFFDKVFTDEIEQIRGFKYFDKFRSLANVTDVLTGDKEGRANDQERILVYNYGIAIHDLYFAIKLMDLVEEKDVEYNYCKEKYFM